MASSSRDITTSSSPSSAAAATATSMFSHSDPSTSGAEEGPASFFCRQCLSAFRRPRILKCLHSFCTSCLEEVYSLSQAKKTGGKSRATSPSSTTLLPCPLCGHSTPLSEAGVEGLPLNSFLQRVSGEYVAEVKSNLASKTSASTHAQNAEGREGERGGGGKQCDPEPSKSAILSRPTSRKEVSFEDDEHGNKMSAASANLTDEQKFNSSLRAPTTESPETVQEAVQNLGRLHAKLVGLQGEALKVTYAIDRVNHHKIEWLQHREDLKRTIQRRSAQFQMMVKKIERKLIAQIDDKNVEGRLYESFEKGKTELRKSLKQVLHEVAVMKGVKEMGSYAEINELSASLLGPSVGVNELVLDKVSFQFDVPTKSIDEMVSVGFGNLFKTTQERAVYRPELKDYTGMKIDEINAEAHQRSQSFALNRAGGVVSAITGDSTSISRRGQGHRSSSLAGRHTQRRGSDLGRTSELEEFQNARESLRNRRQEILQQAHPTPLEASPRRGDGKRLSRPSTRRGRGHSLDRGFKERGDRNQGFLRLQAERRENQMKGVGGGDTSEDDDHETSSTSSTETATAAAEHRSKAGLPDFGSQTFKSEITMPSPIIEEKAPLTTSPARTVAPSLVSSSMATAIYPNQSTKPSSPGSGPVSSGKLSSSFQDLLQASRSPNSPSSSASSSRRVSFDRSPSMSPTAEYSMSPDHLAKVGDPSRHLRRAITSAADKRAKIEFLRENWQKRKEILIQNQGFVSTEEIKSPKPDANAVKALISANATPTEGVIKTENGAHHTQIALASRGIGSPPLRSKFTSATKAQLEQKKFNGKSADTSAKVSPKRINEVTTKPSLTSRSTSLNQDRYATNTEVGNKKKIEAISPSARSGMFDFADKHTKTDHNKDDEEDEEEVEAVQTDTIIVPITQRLTEDTKSGGEFRFPTNKRTEGNELNNINSEIKTNNLTRRETKQEPESNHRSFFQRAPTNSTSPHSPLALRTATAGALTAEPEEGDSSESSSGTNLSSVDSRTRTLTPTSATVSVSPVDNNSAELPSLIAEVAKPPASRVKMSQTEDPCLSAEENNPSQNYTKQLAVKSTVKVEPLPVSSSPSLSSSATKFQKEATTTSEQMAKQGSSPASASNAMTKTLASSNPAATTNSLSTATPQTTTSTSVSTSTQTTTTSSVSTSTSTTAPAKSSRVSYSSSSSRFYRPYTPAASPFAHLYQPLPPPPKPSPPQPSSTSPGTEKSKSDDNKENIISTTRGGSSSTFPNQSNQVHESTQLRWQSSNRTHSEVDDKPQSVVTKSAKETEDTETDEDKQRQSHLHSSKVGSIISPQTTPPSSSTVTGQNSTVHTARNASQEQQTPTNTIRTTLDSKAPSKVSEKEHIKTTDGEPQPTSITPLSPLQAKITTCSGSSSMYSRFYSNQNTLYPKSPETKHKQFTAIDQHHQYQQHESPQDKKVDETFTHAESTRRLYDPAAASKLSRSRRHTVEVGKTLPSGVKILDLYDTVGQQQGQEERQQDGDDIGETSRSLQHRATDTIEEARTESDQAETNTLSAATSQRCIPQSPRTHHSSSRGIIMSSSSSDSFSRGRMPPRQHSLPDKPEVRFAAEVADTLPKQHRDQDRTAATTATLAAARQRQISSSYSTSHLSTASLPSPASSPVAEEGRKFALSRQDSGGGSSSSSSTTGVDSSSKSIKDIARKKRERWRRLTVY